MPQICGMVRLAYFEIIFVIGFVFTEIICFLLGMFVAYTNNDGISKEMTLLAPPDCNKSLTISWLSAMQNGFRLAIDSRIIS